MDPEFIKNFDLNGRTALITGATGGIGRAIARKLSEAGAKTVLQTRANREIAEKLAAELGNSSAVVGDISTETGVISLVEELKSRKIIPDLLVNNAGVQTVSGLLDADETVWQDINAVNLGGLFTLTKHVSQALIAAKKPGVIVNIASIEGLDPAADHAHYAASKAGVIMFTRASALELGTHNIRVNAVSPGLISRSGIADEWPEGVKRWQDRAPLGQLGTGEDVANAVHFLLSPAAKWITGSNLVVDGGMSAQNRW